MKYTYAYKTSDGVRHEDTLTAESREEVFATLRKQGIKAIKVVAADGSKANGEIVQRGIRKRIVALIVFVAACAAGALAYLLAARQTARLAKEPERAEIAFTTAESQAAYTNLEAQTQGILTAHTTAMEGLELDLLANYAFIENTKDTSILTEKIRRGYKTVDASRTAMRELFKSIFILFSAECAAERTAAQRLYARGMDELDVSEGKIVNDEKALKLLNANRGKWHCKKGKVLWTDAALANEFEYFRREVSPSAMRWSKDFGQ